jgi:Asp-tRNA(Asn)/Glu-tRNA(Gln) amidotransferase A subunit family amidase
MATEVAAPQGRDSAGDRTWTGARDRALAARESHRAFITIAADRPAASPGAVGPLQNVAFAVKDNIDTVDLPTTAGTPLLRESRPARDAAVVARLRRAGAAVLGKTNLHELAFGVTSDNAAFGTVLNPRDTSRSPGCSSGGSAVAVALGVVPFALGTDTGGSVRVPAAHCGIVGFRPSSGRYPASGVIRLSSTRDTVGVLAGSVQDVRVVDSAITGQEPSERSPELLGVRLGVPVAGFADPLDPVTAAALADALRRLEAAGATLVELDFSEAQRLDAECGFPIVFAEAPRELNRYLAGLAGPGAGLAFKDLVNSAASPDVARVLAAIAADPVPEAAYLEALLVRRRLLDVYAVTFAIHALDALVYPTVPFPAPPLADRDETQLLGQTVPLFATTIRNAAPSSVAGTPSITVPCAPGSAGALPVGLSIEGLPYHDERLLALAVAVEGVLTPGVDARLAPTTRA